MGEAEIINCIKSSNVTSAVHNNNIYSTISSPVHCKVFWLSLSFRAIAGDVVPILVLRVVHYVMLLGTIIIWNIAS
jgi:hypothetical protein